MNRQDKELLVGSLTERLSKSQAVFLVQVQGLTVAQLQSLRRGVSQRGGQVEVAKNTLLARASQGVAGVEELTPYYTQQIAVVFANSDVPGVARVIYDASKEIEKLSVTIGCFEGQVIGSDEMVFLATLPPREVLLAQVCGGLMAPVTATVSIMHQMIARLLWVLQQASEKEL